MYLRNVLAITLAGATLVPSQAPAAQQSPIPCDVSDPKAAARQLHAKTATDDCRLQAIAVLKESADTESIAALVSAIDWKPAPPPKKGPPGFATTGGKNLSPFGGSAAAEAILGVGDNHPEMVIAALRSLFLQDTLSPEALRNASLLLLFIHRNQDEAIRLLKTEAATARTPERRIALDDQARLLTGRCSERYASRCHAALTSAAR